MKTAAFLALAMTVSTHATDYAPVIPAFESAVREEMATWQLGGLAVAWVDGTQTVYEAGFGEATKDSVFRAGSVSKLFNAVAVMQTGRSGTARPRCRHRSEVAAGESVCRRPRRSRCARSSAIDPGSSAKRPSADILTPPNLGLARDGGQPARRARWSLRRTP